MRKLLVMLARKKLYKIDQTLQKRNKIGNTFLENDVELNILGSVRVLHQDRDRVEKCTCHCCLGGSDTQACFLFWSATGCSSARAACWFTSTHQSPYLSRKWPHSKNW